MVKKNEKRGKKKLLDLLQLLEDMNYKNIGIGKFSEQSIS